MLKARHRYRVGPNTPRASRVPGRVPQRSNIVPLVDVGIVPGNRLILLPLKKVSTIVHRHRWCRSSATSTKTCIVQKARMVSQPVLFQNAPPKHTDVSAGDVVLGNNGLKNILRPGSVRRSNRLARRTSLKRRHPHAAVVKTCLSPVSERDQEDINSMVREFLDVDPGNLSQENKQPVDSLEKFEGSQQNANDTDLSDFGQFDCKMVETERLLKNQVSKEADRQPTSMSTVHGSSLWSENGVHKQHEYSLGHVENGRRLDAHNFVRNTKNYDIFVEAPDLCTESLAGRTDKTCDDDSVLRPCPSLQETQHVFPSLQRHCGIPRAATTIDSLSLVLIKANTSGNRSKLLSQPSNHASSGSILVPVPAANVNVTNCNRAAEGLIETTDSTTVEAGLGQHSEQLKERNIDRKGFELGAVQRVILHNRIRQFPGEAQQDSLLPVLDQFVTKNQSFNNLVDELQKRIAKARFSAELDSVIPSNYERIGRAAALKQETMLRGAQQTVVAHHQRRANKKSRKVVPKIHMFGRNRVSPSSGSVGHKAFQVKSIGQQFLLPPQMPENSVKGVGEFDKRQVSFGRFRNWNEDFHGNHSSAVSYADVKKQKYLKGFLCSCTSGDDLPIGPLRTLQEELLN